MQKSLKKVLSCIIAAAVTFSSVPYTENAIGLSTEVKASSNPSTFQDSKTVDSDVIRDAELLNALKDIIGGGNKFTFKQLKEYNGDIDLKDYPNITNVVGLGYAYAAKSIDLSNQKKVTRIENDEFNSCTFSSFVLPPNITEIGTKAFVGCSNLETIVFPDSLKKIYGQAFMDCYSLDNIEFPKNIEKIGNQAFTNCKSLKKIAIPEGINASVENASVEAENGVGTGVFSGCVNLVSITIPNSMTAIPTAFLQQTKSLLSVNIPEGVISIGDNAFDGSGIKKIDISKNTKMVKINSLSFNNCASLKSVSLPTSIESVEAGAFENCFGLRDFTFLAELSNLRYIGQLAFSGCSMENLVIPGNVETIDTSAFTGCGLLKNVEIKDFTKTISDNTKKVIGKNAFAKCTRLNTVVLPTKNEKNILVTIEIKSYAFSECVRLENINFPENISEIGDYAFQKCAENVTDWQLKHKNVHYEEINTEYKGVTYYVDSLDCISKTKKEGYDEAFLYAVDSDDFCQPVNAYIDRTKLFQTTAEGRLPVVIYEPDKKGSTEMHIQYRFGIKRVDLSNNKNIKLGEGVFSECTSLEYVSLPKTLTVIPKKMFYHCGTDKYLGNGNKASDFARRIELREWFYGLKTVVMSDGVKEIGISAFDSCYKFELSDDLPSKLEKINASAFLNCRAIGEVNLPESLIYIGSSAFKGCSRIIDQIMISGYGLTKCQATADKNLTYIGSSAFDSCSFDSFKMNGEAPAKIISASAFNNCQYMENITFSNNVEYISEGALARCMRLYSVYVTDKCTLDYKMCYGWNSKGLGSFSVAQINANGEYGFVTRVFALSVTPVKSDITVRENSLAVMPVYTVDERGNSIITEINFGDEKYSWQEVNGKNIFVGKTDEVNAVPNIISYNHTIDATPYTDKKTIKVQGIEVSGIKEKSKIPVKVHQSLQIMVTNVSVVNLAQSVDYNVTITANPCKDIKTDDSFFVDYTNTKGKVLSPEFVAQFDDSGITDVVEWSVEGDEDLVELKPSADGKKATIIPKKINGTATCGSTMITIKAGSVKKNVFVYVVPPTSGMTASITKDNNTVNKVTKTDLMYGQKCKLVVTPQYSAANQEFAAQYPDRIDVTSSDESVVKVNPQSIEHADGITTCELVATGAGSAVITATALATGRTYKITVNVSSKDIKVLVTDNEGKEVSSNTDIYSIGRQGVVYKYAFNQQLTLSELAFDIENDKVVSAKFDASKKTFTIAGVGKGKSKVVVYPKVGSPKDNGFVFNVTIDAEIPTIVLSKKTIGLYNTESVFSYMINTFGTKITKADAGEFAKMTDANISFESSAPDYVSVDNYGNVKVDKLSANLDPVTITCNVKRDGKVIKSASTTVKPALPDIKDCNFDGDTTLYVGSTSKFKLLTTPEDALFTSVSVSAQGSYKQILDYSWSSKNMTFSVTGKKKGTVVFNVTFKKDKTVMLTKSFAVVVLDKNSSIKPGQGGSSTATLKAPGKVKISKPKASKKKVCVKWKKKSGASGYVVQMSTKKKKGFKTIKKINSAKTVKFVKKKLKSKKTYYFRVAAFAKGSDGRIKYGKYSKVVKAKVK